MNIRRGSWIVFGILLACLGCNQFPVEIKEKVLYLPPENLSAQRVVLPPLENGFAQVRIVLSTLPDGSVPLDLIRIPPGTFRMGLTEQEITDNLKQDETMTPHEVHLTKPFFLGKYEVTQAQFQAVMGVNPAAFPTHPDNPVEEINYHYTLMFIEKMNELGVGTFRLPTEAEWEYACRAGTTTRFSFGDAPDCVRKKWSALGDQYMWWGGNLETAMRGPMPVGKKQPNPWGLFDMHGNCYEWCSDYFRPYPSPPQTDPQGSEKPGARVFRSGPWNGEAEWCQSGRRNWTSPNNAYHWLGLRLVLEAEEEGEERKKDL